VAFLIPTEGSRQPIKGPFTLTALKTFVGGPIEFIDLSYGDVLVINSTGLGAINPVSHTLVKQMVHGPVVICAPEDIS
jgi:hypothetical protein